SKDRILAYTEYGTKWRKPLPGEKATLRPAVGASTYNGGSKTRSILAGVPLNENPTNPADVPCINQIYNVRGHLIANTFGGPNSRASRNIVAITETANKQMKRVEDSIRLGYLKKPATESFVIRYEVTPDPDKSPPQTISLSATREWPEPKGVAIPLPTNSIDNVP